MSTSIAPCMRRTQTTPRYLLLRPQHHYLAGKYHCHDYCTYRYLCHCCKLVIQSLTLCVQIAVRGLDHYRTRAQAATVVTLRRRRARSEAAKQKAESQTNRRWTRLLRYQATTGCPKKKYLSEISGSEIHMKNLDHFGPFWTV